MIENYIQENNYKLDLSKFMIQILPFETDNEFERYKVVRRVVDDFVGDLNINIPGLGKKLLNVWHESIFVNGTKKNSNILLSKKDVIWPIIVIATEVEWHGDSFEDYFDISSYSEILYQYKDYIDSCSEEFEIMTKILYDFKSYKYDKPLAEKAKDFAINCWQNYSSDFDVDGLNDEIKKGLIQMIIYKIVRNRLIIGKVKEVVNL